MIRQCLVRIIGVYQYFLSPLTQPACRFTPTCSHYACEAITKYGALRGTWLSSKRLLRCNPWNSGGYDPVP